MIPLISLLVVLLFSVLITRVATIALIHTGLSAGAARFQARSAFTGAGFTTGESERVVNHPVRRRIVMILMLLGNAGVVTIASTLILTFVNVGDAGMPAWQKVLLLGAGLAFLWIIARSRAFDRLIYRIVSWALRRYTRLDVQDYAGLLHLAGEYQVVELVIKNDDWLAGYTLGELKLRDEGIMVLAVERPNGDFLGVPTMDTQVRTGDTLIAYGRVSAIKRLDDRRRDTQGFDEHRQAVAEQRQAEEQEQNQDCGSSSDGRG